MNNKETGIIKYIYINDNDEYISDDSFDDDVSVIRTKHVMGKFNDCELGQTFQNNKTVPVTVTKAPKWISKRKNKADKYLNKCCDFEKVELVSKKRFAKQHKKGFKPYCQRNFNVIATLQKNSIHTNVSFFAQYLIGEGLYKLSKLILSIMKKRLYDSNIDFPKLKTNIGEYPINENVNCFIGYLFELKIDEAELISVIIEQIMYGSVPEYDIQNLPNFIKQKMPNLEDEFHIFLTNNPDYDSVAM